ncbi:MAG: hypothetical protein ABIN48_12550, partial [Ginsengibacter sp.]
RNMEYKSWLTKNGLSFKNGNINVRTGDENIISGKLDWSKSKNYDYKGRAYLEVPFLFNQNLFIHFKEFSGSSQFSMVFRNLPNEEFEAAIRSTTSGKIIHDEFGNKNEGTIQSYFLLNGEKKTLWVKREKDKSFIRVKRVRNDEVPRVIAENKSVQRSSCSTIAFTEYSVYCWGDVECVTYSHTSYYIFCTGDRNDEKIDDGDWGGGGGGGGDPSPPPPINQPDTCNTAKAMEATSFSSLPIFDSAKSQIQNAASDGNEHAISFGKNPNGNVIKSEMSTGNEYTAPIPYIENVIADFHNHQNVNPPTAGDIYTFIDKTLAHSTYETRYVMTMNGTIYALVINNLQDAIDFNTQHPRQPPIGDFEPDFPEDINNEINEMVQTGSGTIEIAITYILSKYKTGVSLMRANAGGQFKKLRTEVINNGGNTIYISNNCQ